MGEQAVKIGKKLEGFGEHLFSGFGWTELTRDREIECKRSSHGKKTHGLDLVMKFNNLYISSQQGIIIECKNRQMVSITQSNIETWVKELVHSIECSQSSEQLSDLDLEGTTLNTGMLLIHANDCFDEEKFSKYLKGMSISGRRNPINIFIAGNNEIDQWNALITFVRSNFSDNFAFLYPSINGSTKTSTASLSINALYSKYFFAQRTKMVPRVQDGVPYSFPVKQAILFSFDDISKDSFRYMWSMFKYYQFEDCDEYVFVFYPRKANDVEFVKENFIRALSSGCKPLPVETLERVKLNFLTNRKLSPVDN